MPNPYDVIDQAERALTRLRGQLAAMECCFNAARKLMLPTAELRAMAGLIETMDHEAELLETSIASLPDCDAREDGGQCHA